MDGNKPADGQPKLPRRVAVAMLWVGAGSGVLALIKQAIDVSKASVTVITSSRSTDQAAQPTPAQAEKPGPLYVWYSGYPPTSPLNVARVMIGRATSDDGRVILDTNVFAPRDTVDLTVFVTGKRNPPGVSVITVWYDGQDQQIGHSERFIAPQGHGHVDFHFSQPGGLRVGEYRVDVFLNNLLAARATYMVR